MTAYTRRTRHLERTIARLQIQQRQLYESTPVRVFGWFRAIQADLSALERKIATYQRQLDAHLAEEPPESVSPMLATYATI